MHVLLHTHPGPHNTKFTARHFLFKTIQLGIGTRSLVSHCWLLSNAFSILVAHFYLFEAFILTHRTQIIFDSIVGTNLEFSTENHWVYFFSQLFVSFARCVCVCAWNQVLCQLFSSRIYFDISILYLIIIHPKQKKLFLTLKYTEQRT